MSKAVLLLVCFTAVMQSSQTITWTWISGSSQNEQGVCGEHTDGHRPGARDSANLVRCRGQETLLYLLNGVTGISPLVRCGDMWMFDLMSLSWTQLTLVDPKPPARFNAVGWCDLQDRIWIYGGDTTILKLSDVWWFDISLYNWTYVLGNTNSQEFVSRVDPLTPGSRYSPVFTADEQGNMIMFGGYGQSGSDLWRFNVSSQSWELLWDEFTSPSPEAPPLTHEAAIGLYDNTVIIGFGLTYPDDRLYEYDLESGLWKQLRSGISTANFPSDFGIIGSSFGPGPLEGVLSWMHEDILYVAFGNYHETGDTISNAVWFWNRTANSYVWIDGTSIIDDPGTYNGYLSKDSLPFSREDASSAPNNGFEPFIFFFGGYYELDTSNAAGFSDLWLIQYDEFSCLPGEFSYLGTTTCYQCEYGTYSFGNTSSCFDCDASTSLELCICPLNTVFNGTECVSCPQGRFMNESKTCIDCSVGKFLNESKICVDCPEGTYRSDGNSSSCSACEEGFTNNEDHTGCELDTVSTVTTITGITYSSVTVGISGIATMVTVLTGPTTNIVSAITSTDGAMATGQLISLFGMINEYQSVASVSFAMGFSWMMGFFDFEIFEENHVEVNNPLQRYANLIGFPLGNLLPTVVLIFFALITVLSLIFIGICVFSSKQCGQKTYEIVKRLYCLSCLKLMFVMYYPMTIAGLLELSHWSNSNLFRRVLTTVCITAETIGVIIIGIVASYRVERGDTENPLGAYFSNYHYHRRRFFILVFLDRFLKCFVVVNMQGFFQILLFVQIQLLYVVCLALLRPYKVMSNQVVNLVTSLSYLIASILQILSYFVSSVAESIGVLTIILQALVLLSTIVGQVMKYLQLKQAARLDHTHASM